ncbi:MAG: FAD binding domain-containing protein [Pseudomonadales bacterium]|nr:FAD binding domain-containing protein [Pseudomonadales bacterium]MDP6469950.1 FAD binding domain-containing protein [Pseudomonadales bacterium]MDP6829117.1 FAD binding domain-containing protein [Pseudomonadales bacterium]MDP6971785.1 FAD binding domain-containing protein [Pseudomonadales bacterium]
MLRLPPIEFATPRSLADVLPMLGDDSVRVVAGGTDLWPNMKRRHQQARTVVSLMSVPELRGIAAGGDELRLGATTTLTSILRDEALCTRFPSFARAVASISSPPLRNMGTLGGNLCVDTRCTYYNQSQEWRSAIGFCLKEQGETCWVATGSPRCWAHSASDAAPVLCALGARVKLVSGVGERVIPLAELYQADGIDFLTKRHDELLSEVLIPSTSDADHCSASFWKLRRRGSIDFSVLSVAVVVWMDSASLIDNISIYLGAVESCPIRVDVADIAVGRMLDTDLIDEIARRAQRLATPMDTADFTPSWRGKMVEQYTIAALRELAGLPVMRLAPHHHD